MRGRKVRGVAVVGEGVVCVCVCVCGGGWVREKNGVSSVNI